MKNLLKKTIATLVVTVILFSCSKSDDPAPEVLAPLQDPFPGFLETSGLNNIVPSLNLGFKELGLSFSPLVKGKITAIVVKMPETQNGLRVTIWDKSTSTVLRTESIDVMTPDTETIKQITPLNLEQFKDYMISINTNDAYYRTKSNQSAISYPFIIGDIKITSFNIKSGTDQVIPSEIYSDSFRGDFSFKFQK